jgi:uncharacterized protein (DUF4415 family)
MNDEYDFDEATRKLLFGTEQQGAGQQIPGQGRSAAESPARHVRVKITMNIDGDLVSHFKSRAQKEGRAYQFLINEALRESIEGNRVERVAVEVTQMLLEDERFIEALQRKLEGR